MAIFRRTPPTVDFVAVTPKLVATWPPVPAAKAAPDWWRAQPPFMQKRKYPNLRTRSDTTIKSCPGVADYMGLGYVVPMWADYIVTATPDGFTWEAACPPQVNMFQPQMWDHFPRPDDAHGWMLKITAPWYVRTPKGYSVLILGPWYHRNSHWTVFPGVLDADRLPVLNLICMWHAPVGEAVLIKAGTPLFQVIPFRREKFALDIRADEDEFDTMTGVGVGAVNGWNRLAAGAFREARQREEQHAP